VDSLNDVAVSAVSGWEIAIKTSMAKLSLPGDLEAELLRAGIRSFEITLTDGLRAGALPRHHNDPFDRMLVAQAQTRGMTLVTRDAMLAAYGVPILAA
jgi:PIN domain nuclease of toxin-antitoxin system